MRHPDFPGLEITLSVAGRTLNEYEDESEDNGGLNGADKVGQYVEAVPGANFEINVVVGRTSKYSTNAITAYTLGGSGAPCDFWHRKYTASGGWEFSKFAFAELATNDGRPEGHFKEKLALLGEVSVKLHRVRKLGTCEARRNEFKPTVDTAGIPEKALKGRAIFSYATLSKGQPIGPVNHYDVEYPWGTRPFATFTFKYRSRKDLQIEGLIPRSPSPVPLEDRDPDTLTAEEARELVRIQRQKSQDQARVKKEETQKRECDEEGEDEDEADGAVEATGQRRKRQRLSNDSGIEVIDISNEDDEN